MEHDTPHNLKTDLTVDNLKDAEKLLGEQGLYNAVSSQEEMYTKTGRKYSGGNLLATVRRYAGGIDMSSLDAPMDDTLTSMRVAEKMATAAGIEGVASAVIAEGLLHAGIDGRHGKMTSERPLVYETTDEKLAAADALIEERLEHEADYAYYDLYREQGLLHEEEGQLPYLILYRRTNNSHPEQEMAAGFRSGVFSADELQLPPSIKSEAVSGRKDGPLIKFESMFTTDQVEAYQIGQSSHDASPYLSASYAEDSRHPGGSYELTMKVPACVTLPVEFLIKQPERYDEILRHQKFGIPLRPADREDPEKEIAILGRIRPEWIVSQSGRSPE